MLENDCDLGRPLRLFLWLRNNQWVSKEGTTTLLRQFVDIVHAACGKNEPCTTDSDLVWALAPLVRLAALNDTKILNELRDAAETLLMCVETQGELIFRVDSMSYECANLCEVAINALFLLYAPLEEKEPREKMWKPRLVR